MFFQCYFTITPVFEVSGERHYAIPSIYIPPLCTRIRHKILIFFPISPRVYWHSRVCFIESTAVTDAKCSSFIHSTITDTAAL